MDLVYIRRKYKNIRNSIIILFLVIVAIYCFFITFIVLNNSKNNKLFEDYESHKEKIHQTEGKQEEIKEEQQIQKLPIITEETIQNIKNIYNADTHKAYLTFDDGPSLTVTPQILDILKQENIKATFFVLGSRVDLNPNLVKREYEEGHYIANHGYSHVYSQIYRSSETVLEEYNKTEQTIRNAIGIQEYNSYLFRFPGGSVGGKYANLKSNTSSVLDSNKIAYVDWNALTGDAEGKKTKEAMLNYLRETVGDKKNVVILMHDAGDKTATAEVLLEVISFLREKGYEFDNFYSFMK